jgi:hypothetical protein
MDLHGRQEVVLVCLEKGSLVPFTQLTFPGLTSGWPVRSRLRAAVPARGIVSFLKKI